MAIDINPTTIGAFVTGLAVLLGKILEFKANIDKIKHLEQQIKDHTSECEEAVAEKERALAEKNREIKENLERYVSEIGECEKTNHRLRRQIERLMKIPRSGSDIPVRPPDAGENSA